MAQCDCRSRPTGAKAVWSSWAAAAGAAGSDRRMTRSGRKLVVRRTLIDPVPDELDFTVVERRRSERHPLSAASLCRVGGVAGNASGGASAAALHRGERPVKL